MSSLGNSLASVVGMGRRIGLPPLPPGLGLPEKSKAGTIGSIKGEVDTSTESYKRQRTQAETYNKAFADLLNNQPHLSGAQRSEIYKAYSDKFIGQRGAGRGNGTEPLTDYSKILSQAPAMSQAEMQAAQQAPQTLSEPEAVEPPKQVGTLGAAGTVPPQQPAPVATAPQVQAPQTVGPVAKPQEAAPPATPTVATPTGNIAGQTATIGTMGADAAGRGRRRGRMATLLTGLGGAVESFGGQ